MLEGHSRRVWRKAGRDVIEAITVDGMAHGVPLATSGPMRCGNAGAFHFDVGISSSHRILEFWQLTDSSQAFADKVADLNLLIDGMCVRFAGISPT